MDEKLTYKKLIELIDCVKMYSGCDSVKLVGNHKTFEEIMAMGFPLNDFKYEKILDEFDRTQLYIMPIEN